MTYHGNIQWREDRFCSALHEKCVTAAALVGAAVMDAARPYVPYDTGRLSASVRYARTEGGAGGSILWETPYASHVYYGDLRGIRFSREHHPHAAARWFEAAKSTNLTDWRQRAARMIGGAVR